MPARNTYVTSINGITGALPYELDYVNQDPVSGDYSQEFGQVTHKHKNVVIDGSDIHISGSSGSVVTTVIQQIANTMRPLILDPINDGNDYIMKVQAGIPYTPSVE